MLFNDHRVIQNLDTLRVRHYQNNHSFYTKHSYKQVHAVHKLFLVRKTRFRNPAINVCQKSRAQERWLIKVHLGTIWVGRQGRVCEPCSSRKADFTVSPPRAREGQQIHRSHKHERRGFSLKTHIISQLPLITFQSLTNPQTCTV